MMKLMNLRIACWLAAGWMTGAGAAYGQNAGQLIALSVSQIDAGSPSFSLGVKGGNFVQGSTVYWGTRTLFTSFVDANNVSATVTSDLLAISGQNQITVQNPNGAISAFSYLYVEPVLYSVSPTGVPLGSGQQTVTVVGVGFNQGDVLQVNPVGSINNLQSSYVSPTTLTAVLPASLLAKSSNAAVLVVQAGCCVSRPTYLQIGTPPIIATLNPSSVTSGTPGFFMTVTGSGFQTGAVVYFNGSAAPSTYVNPSLINVQVPASPALSLLTPLQVYVLNPDGGTSNAAVVTVLSSGAVITGLFPASGTGGMGDFTLTVNGSGFQSGAKVLWNGTALATAGSGSQLQATVPAALTAVPGTAQITVQNPGAGASAAFPFVYAGPHISSLTPATIGAGSSDFTLGVNGSAFLNTSTVIWNALPLSTTFVSGSQLTAAVPAALIGSPAPVNITVSNSGTLSNAAPFAVAAPTIQAMTPSIASAGSNGFTMTVTGTGYTPTSQLQWNTTLLPIVFLATSQFTASIPPNLLTTPGTVQVSVVNPGGTVSNSLTFTLNAPVITQLNPATAPVGSGALNISAVGSGFAAGSQLFWNSTALVTNYISPNQLNARVTADLLATAGNISVTVLSPGGAKSNAVSFSVTNGMPAITTLSPASAAAGGAGFVLTVNGGAFPADAVVQWNGAALPTTYVSASQVTAQVEASLIAAVGSASVTVTSSMGTSNAVTFNIIASGTAINAGGIVNGASNLPAIAPGSLISIYGANLAAGVANAATVPLPLSLGNVSMTINGVAAPLIYVGPTQINAQVPYETQVGTATLTLQTGNGTASGTFAVTATGPGIAVVQNFTDGALNSASDPISVGQYVVVYMTGQGVVDHPVATGAAAGSDPLSNAVARVTATVGGQSAPVLFAGLTPGLVGVLQVDLQIPNVPSGNQSLAVTIGSAISNSVTIAVK